MKKALIILILLTPCLNVYASEKSSIIVNRNGVSMTQEEYDYIEGNFGKTFADLANEDFINGALNGDVEKIKPNYVPSTIATIHPISDLSLNIDVSLLKPNKQYLFLLSAIWNPLPDMKSFDIMGFRWSNNLVIDEWKVKQDYGYGVINYSLTGNNTKYNSNGVGTSMNLLNDATGALLCYMEFTGHFTSSAETTVSGSYQHAWKDVTLEQSQEYTFNSAGLGNVFYYPSTIRSLYTNFDGVTFDFTSVSMN